jgi:branched-chain amino acid transport system permease protein
MTLFLQVLFSGLTTGSIYSLVALGFTVIYMASRVLNIAQGEFLMIGGLTFYSFLTISWLPMPAIFLASVGVVILVSILFDKIVIDPFVSVDVSREVPIMRFLLITIAVSYILQGGGFILWGSEPHSVPHFSSDTPLFFFGASMLPQTLWILGVTLILLIFLFIFFKYSLLGKAMKACSENRATASLLGINVRSIVLLAFILSGSIGAIAGILITPITTMIYSGGVMLMIKGIIGAKLGGLGTVAGAVLGGLVVGLLEALVSVIPLGIHGGLMREICALIILLGILAIKPTGLLGGAAGEVLE